MGRSHAARLMVAASAWLAAAVCVGAALDTEGAARRQKQQAALKPLGSLVGKWRGTGQVRRGVGQGAWTESAEWVWKLDKKSAALEFKVATGKYLKSATLVPGKSAGVFQLVATLADGSERYFGGKAAAGGKLILSTPAGGAGVRRITLTPLHDTRLLVLYEGRAADSEEYARLGEVGYTREGVAFAAGESGPVCIVTEGRGSIPVSYQGKTYYVCCSGCRDLFNENPAAILAEAAAREKAKKVDD